MFRRLIFRVNNKGKRNGAKARKEVCMKVTIIGAGSVGSTIAFTLATNGTASDIVLIDVNEEKAKGEAMDILQGAPFFGSMSIIAGDYSDAVGSDIVIITSGIPRKPGQSRLELAQTNVNIMKDIASKITVYAPKAIYIIVSNPVDVMTYAFHKFSGIPENQIIGSGTILDTYSVSTAIPRSSPGPWQTFPTFRFRSTRSVYTTPSRNSPSSTRKRLRTMLRSPAVSLSAARALPTMRLQFP